METRLQKVTTPDQFSFHFGSQNHEKWGRKHQENMPWKVHIKKQQKNRKIITFWSLLGGGWGSHGPSFCFLFSALGSFGDQNGSWGSPGSPPGPSRPRFSLFLMIFGSMFHMIFLCCFLCDFGFFKVFLEFFWFPQINPHLGELESLFL